jgi:hypothetical protein
MTDHSNINDDLLYGAQQLAEFLYGDPTVHFRIYKLIDKGVLPHFRLGGTICARKSTLMAWVADQEHASIKQAPAA